MTHEQLMSSLSYHKPSKEVQEQIVKVREQFKALASNIDRRVPESRHKSLYQTKLEEAQMWAIKAMVADEPEA